MKKTILFIVCLGSILSVSADFNTTLSLGSRGSEVSKVQSFLGVEPTGYFGMKTYQAVKLYQEQNNLPIVGIWGKMTRTVANRIVITPKQQPVAYTEIATATIPVNVVTDLAVPVPQTQVQEVTQVVKKTPSVKIVLPDTITDNNLIKVYVYDENGVITNKYPVSQYVSDSTGGEIVSSMTLEGYNSGYFAMRFVKASYRENWIVIKIPQIGFEKKITF